MRNAIKKYLVEMKKIYVLWWQSSDSNSGEESTFEVDK